MNKKISVAMSHCLPAGITSSVIAEALEQDDRFELLPFVLHPGITAEGKDKLPEGQHGYIVYDHPVQFCTDADRVKFYCENGLPFVMHCGHKQEIISLIGVINQQAWKAKIPVVIYHSDSRYQDTDQEVIHALLLLQELIEEGMVGAHFTACATS